MNTALKSRIPKVWGCVLTAIVLSLCMILPATNGVYVAPAEAQANNNIVALSFDDGPDPANTPQILDILKRHKVKATFFVVGKKVKKLPGLVRREYRQGHIVGNHSYTHTDLTRLSEAEVEQELMAANAAIRAAGVPRPNLFRPPYGETNGAVEGIATSLGMTQTLWAVDAYDKIKPAPPTELCERVVGGVSPGTIVVMHDGGSVYTDDALGCIIKRLKSQGYSFGRIYPSENYDSLNGSYVEIR